VNPKNGNGKMEIIVANPKNGNGTVMTMKEVKELNLINNGKLNNNKSNSNKKKNKKKEIWRHKS